MTHTPLIESTLPLPLIRQGKVREVYEVDDTTVLLVASDRISAFDVVLQEPIPHKGTVLTQISAYWFRRLEHITPSHFITADIDEIVERIPALQAHCDDLRGRSMLARRVQPIPFECVVRGYITGSAWKEYRTSGTLAGERLPGGLRECERLDPPIFSPATKAESGHDENITFTAVEQALGSDEAAGLRTLSLALYEAGRERAAERGIIIADTKFEFGRDGTGAVLLIDELLTPDSSRFWPAADYAPGRSQASFDKQPMRDYLDELRKRGEWSGDAPAPALTAAIVRATSERYVDAYRRITGEALPGTG